MFGSRESDEELLVAALRESGAKGLTYRQALEGLHGVHNHTANQWKDYYLEHTQRINSLLSQRNGDRPVAVAKKPAIDSKLRNGSSSHLHGHSSSPPVKVKHERVSAADRGRSDTKVKVKTERTGKAKSKDRVSRTPSPPRNPVKRGQKYSFTDEDRDWFVRYANYRLKEDPNLKKLDICAELAKKAPHHSALSWMSHWGQQRVYYASVIPHFQEYVSKEEPITGDSASSGEDSEEDDDGTDSQYSSSASESSEETDSEEDIKNMSGAGRTLNDADKRVLARYIAAFGTDWDHMSYKDRWESIVDKYPQRNLKAWAQIFHVHSRAINNLARKYRRRSFARKSVLSQKAVPSWAKKQTSSAGLKRVRSYEEEDSQSSKRTRDEPSL
ncbi:uncharacterized protein PHACADRAFT_247540 [Phanerochaete carnosa HHB-10118-sp]|uniref:DNA-binding protein RAP1 n=1 Tax=Phanerochaete carnosa (strain HHB-10118-sp) TaxID=650164 RepID=K5VDS8_PHACS|nr:uncharacterized protein PHACADRAFT_247540 [Phanerochaete carnosa HHB-10118-sp]EKM61141.1 hypothetical protein PHACADRAFT_247540 [Phanerochaete carnosa HHB-10118-sp]